MFGMGGCGAPSAAAKLLSALSETEPQDQSAVSATALFDRRRQTFPFGGAKNELPRRGDIKRPTVTVLTGCSYAAPRKLTWLSYFGSLGQGPTTPGAAHSMLSS